MKESGLYNWIKQVLGNDKREIPEIPQELMPILQELFHELEAEKQRRVDTEKELAFFEAAANAFPNPIFIKDEELRFMFFNRAYRKFFGLAEGENIGKRVQDLSYLPLGDRERYHREDSEMVRSLSVIQYETTFETADQEDVEALYWSKGFAIPGTKCRGVIGEIVDISKEKEMQKELTRSVRALEVLMKDAKDASNTDSLTKLYNRNIIEDEIPLVLKEAELVGQPVCVMLIDIDYFKQINDTYGHPYGDEILQRFSRILKQTFRQQDIAVRYGGDEFVLFLPGADLRQATEGAERLRKAVNIKLRFPNGKSVTISIGVTQWRKGEEVPDFISRADEALYFAKESGRDRVSVKE